ncbi:hypothetical protein [Rhizobacter sp. Root1221]|uniref:hypothetical protein n=1 Tax=Rhizobacter sp. Root1221 TaxID=1736433 RepID=UPI0006FD9DF6|nr:hypothetical protein [Rhizobacter sp. Root1221]KQW02334.1 hypothetical protein ASC87_14030 [Rhizobacter sp. Root1221]
MMDLTTLVPGLQDARVEVYDEFSRYRGLPLLSFVDAAGREHVYGGRRIVPQPETMPEVARVTVRDGDRLDNVAAVQFGDARWWWRIADANRALAPTALTGPQALGRGLRITLPEGVPLPRQG